MRHGSVCNTFQQPTVTSIIDVKKTTAWGESGFPSEFLGRLRPAARLEVQDGPGGRGVDYRLLGPAAVEALLAIRPQEAVIDPGASVFNLSAGQISRRIKAATKMAGLGDGFSAHSPRLGMAQDLSAAGAKLPELMTAGRCYSPTMPAAAPRPSPPAGGPSHVITGGSSET